MSVPTLDSAVTPQPKSRPKRDEMVPNIADIGRATGQRCHQTARFYFTFGQTS